MGLLQSGAAQRGEHLSGLADSAVLEIELTRADHGREAHAAGCQCRQVLAFAHDGKLVGTHVLEDAQLGVVVVLHLGVAVHVVGRKIEPDGHFGAEIDDGFHLERGNFQHGELRLGLHERHFAERIAVVAASLGGLAGSQQHMLEQGGGGGFAVGAGNGDDAAAVVVPGEFRFADERGTMGSEGECPGDVALDTGGKDNEVCCVGACMLLRGAGGEAHAGFAAGGSGVGIENAHLCGALGQSQAGSCHTAAAATEHC